MEWLIVPLGGGIGASLRYLVQQWVVKKGINSYWATALVNIVGSFMLGITSEIAMLSSTVLAFFTVGILGAFTTFSTFAFDSLKLIEAKNYKIASLFILVNLVGGIIGFAIGWLI